MTTAAVLEIADLTAVRGGFGLTLPRLRLDPGQVLAVTGPSGCGKSTLLDVLGLVLRPRSAATFTLLDRPLLPLWATKHTDPLAPIRARHLGYVLQTGGLLPFLSVADNIRLSLEVAGKADPDNLFDHLTQTLGLKRLLKLSPAALSIGERQRVAIARALLHRPALVLADEPTAALDPRAAQTVMELFLTLARSLGIATIIVCHDWDLVARHGLLRLHAHLDTGEKGAAHTTFVVEDRP